MVEKLRTKTGLGCIAAFSNDPKLQAGRRPSRIGLSRSSRTPWYGAHRASQAVLVWQPLPTHDEMKGTAQGEAGDEFSQFS